MRSRPGVVVGRVVVVVVEGTEGVGGPEGVIEGVAAEGTREEVEAGADGADNRGFFVIKPTSF